MLLLLASFSIFGVILISGLIPLLWNWKAKHLDISAAFGAGVLLATAFIHMLPEATEVLHQHAGFWTLGGFLLIYFLEDVTMAHPHGGELCQNHNHKIGWSALAGLSIHSIIAGVALGVSLQGSNEQLLSLAILAAIAIHKVPETLALTSLLLNAGWSKKSSLFALLVFACMGPSGVLISSSDILAQSSHTVFAAALAVSAGTFVFIASSDLLPSLHKDGTTRWWNLLAFFAGILLLSFHVH